MDDEHSPDNHHSRFPRITFSDRQPGWILSMDNEHSPGDNKVEHSSIHYEDDHSPIDNSDQHSLATSRMEHSLLNYKIEHSLAMTKVPIHC